MKKTYSYIICGQINSRLDASRQVEFFTNLRNSLPNAEIIVSTWEGDFDPNLEKFVDRTVRSVDPGQSEYGANWNRILLSTKSGIEASTCNLLVRSRIEVSFSGLSNFDNFLCSLDVGGLESVILFPENVSQYMLNKGLLFGLPDFFQIAKREFLLAYWGASFEESTINLFHMKTGNANSFSSDQVLCANYLSGSNDLKKSYDRFEFSFTNWRIFAVFLTNQARLFSESELGVDFGRLARIPKAKLVETISEELSLKRIKLRRTTLLKFFSHMKYNFARRHFFIIYSKSSLLKTIKRLLPTFL